MQTETNPTSGVLQHCIGKSNLLVSFGGVHQGLGIPVFEFYKTIEHLDTDKVFVRDLHQCWYQDGADTTYDSIDSLCQVLSDIMTNNNYKKIVFLGNSMGGFAAMLFGTMLQVEHCIAFSPQSFVNRWSRMRYLDYRWYDLMPKVQAQRPNSKQILNLKQFLASQNTSTHIDIYYPKNNRLDKIHARYLSAFPQVHLYPKVSKDHSVIRSMRDSGELKQILEQSLA